MTIASYSDLQIAVGNWLQRSDLAAIVPDFIGLFEAAANRRLRVRQQEASVALVPGGDGDVSLPGDYLAWRRVTWTGTPRMELAYVEPSWLQAAHPIAYSAPPRVFAIEGETLKIAPRDQTALEFAYFQKIPSLSNGNASNWLLAAHPDLYLFGALAEAQAYAVDFNAAGLWKARRDELFDEIEKLSNRSRGAGAVRVLGVTP